MENEVLDRLEEKARRAAETLTSLRAENEQLARELEDARAASDGGGGSHERMEQELRLLHDERDAVRKRVEGLITLLEEAL